MTQCKDKGIYLSDSKADGQTISTTSELGDFVASNLLSPAADLAWRGALDSTITIDFDEAVEIDCFALCLHNLTPYAVITISLYGNAATAPTKIIQGLAGSQNYSLTASAFGVNTGGFNTFSWNGANLTYDAAYAYFVDIADEPTTTIRATIRIQDPDNADGHIQLRRLKIGKCVKHENNFDYGYQFGFISGEKHRGGKVTWSWHDAAERAAANELIRTHSVDKDKYARTRNGELLGFDDDILWIGFPNSEGAAKHQHTSLVALVDAEAPYRPNDAMGKTTFTLEEIYFGFE
jgi:hypothetical protein